MADCKEIGSWGLVYEGWNPTPSTGGCVIIMGYFLSLSLYALGLIILIKVYCEDLMKLCGLCNQYHYNRCPVIFLPFLINRNM